MSDSALPEAETGQPVTLRSPLVAVAAPATFVLFGLFVPVATIVTFPLLFDLVLSILIVGIAAGTYLVEGGLDRHRIKGVAPVIRELVAVLVGVALITWAVVHRSLIGLVASPELWTALIASFFAWLLTGMLRRALMRREFFIVLVLRAVAARPGPAPTVAVAAATRDLAVEAGEAAAAVARARRLLLFFLIWGLLVLIGGEWGLHRSDPLIEIGLAIGAVIYLGGLSALGRMSEDQQMMMYGVVPSRRGATRQATLSGLLFLVAIAAAAALSLAPPAISQAMIAAFFAWIAWLFSLIPSPKLHHVAAPSLPRAAPPPRPEIFHHLQQSPPPPSAHLIGTILTYLGWSVVAAAALAFLWLLLAPLFRLHYKTGGLAGVLEAARRALSRTLYRLLRRLQDALATVIGLRGELALAGGAERAREEGSDRAPRRRRRRRGLFGGLLGGSARRFGRAFLRLVHWGERRGVPFSRSMGPREYAERLAATLPEVAGELRQIAELYERHLFSGEELSPEELASYYAEIMEVMRHE